MVNKKLTDKAKEDLILVKSALDNTDARAFSKLLSKYRDPIYFKLLEMLNDKELAQELTIESFGKAFNNLSTYSSTYAFSTWLFSIAKNHCID
ncbi:MAG: sigma factor, partial [Bacteroidota bacterium]|nr:sigma factor [Bacteroidota bacterium]